MDMCGAGSDEPDWRCYLQEPAEETEPAIAMDPSSALCAPVVAAAGGTGDQEETFQDMEAKQLQLRVAELERQAEGLADPADTLSSGNTSGEDDVMPTEQATWKTINETTYPPACGLEALNMSATSNAGNFANEEGSSKTKKPADKKSVHKKCAPKKIIKKTAPFTPKIFLNTSTNSVSDAAFAESFESFPVNEEAFIVQDSPLLAAGADMIDPAAMMDETERKHYEKRMALMKKKCPEKFAEAKANGVFYSRKDPKRPDLMCQCGKVQRMKNGVHRFRDCQNARCKHLKKGGNGRLFRKACSKCSPQKFCSKCLSSATGEPLRLDQCRCPDGTKVPMARVQSRVHFVAKNSLAV